MLAIWNDVAQGKLTADTKDGVRLVKELVAPKPKPCNGNSGCTDTVIFKVLPIPDPSAPKALNAAPNNFPVGLVMLYMEWIVEGKLKITDQATDRLFSFLEKYRNIKG